MKFRLPNPFRDAREARAMNKINADGAAELQWELLALRETTSAEINRRDVIIAGDKAEIRALKADREKDLDALNALAEERATLIDQVKSLSAQYYKWAGPAMDDPAPRADEGSKVIPIFSMKPKARERMN